MPSQPIVPQADPKDLSAAQVLRPEIVAAFHAALAKLAQPPARPRAGLNARLADLVCRRWATLTGSSAAPQPQRLVYRRTLGCRRTETGYGLLLRFVYHSPRGLDYTVEGFVAGYEDGTLAGRGRARSCSCPDFGKRRGPARDQLKSEARCCKHMLLFEMLAATWAGLRPWGGWVTVTDGVLTVREF